MRTLQQLITSATWLANVLPNGIARKRGDYGTDAMPRAALSGQSGSGKRGSVIIAAIRSRLLSGRTLIDTAFARLTAKQPRIAHVAPLLGRADVWCLTVPGVENFALVNGAIVHNCADAARTLAMGLREVHAKQETTVTPPRPRADRTTPSWMGA